MKITDEEKIVVDTTLMKVAAWVESRKLSTESSPLVSDATGGFNLACDFISNEIKRMREQTDWQSDGGFLALYHFHLK